MIKAESRELAQRFLGLGAFKAFSMILGFLTTILLARYLGPESYGQYVFILALLPVVAVPMIAGLQSFLVREAARLIFDRQWSSLAGLIRSANLWVLLVTVVYVAVFIAFVALFGVELIQIGGETNYLVILLFLLPVMGFNAVRNGLLKGAGLVLLSEFPVHIIRPIFFVTCIGLLLLIKELNVFSALWSHVVANSITLLLATIIFYRYKPSSLQGVLPVYTVKKWLTSLWPFSLIALVGTLNGSACVLILGFIGLDEDVAGFRMAERFSQLVSLPLMLMNLIIAPKVVGLYKEKNIFEVKRLFFYCSRWSFFMAVIISVPFLFFGSLIIEYTAGEVYLQTTLYPIYVLVASQLVNVYFGSVGLFLSMCGFEKDVFRGHASALIISSLVCVPLSYFWGGLGASIAVSLGMVFWNIYLSNKIMHRIGINAFHFRLS